MSGADGGFTGEKWFVVAGAAVAVFAIGFALLQPSAASGPPPVADPRPPVTASPAAMESARLVRAARVDAAERKAADDAAIVAAARAKADAIWTAYDKMPARKKTMLAVRDSMAEGTAIINSLPQPASGQIAGEHMANARRRLAPIQVPGAVATGDEAKGFVPTQDPDVCYDVCETVAAEGADNLCPLGFTAIVCPAQRRPSQVTGKMIEVSGKQCTLACP